MMNIRCQSPEVAPRVCAASSVATSSPATGPKVQNPIAEARPSWGVKSRTSAGVATRMIPSNSPTATIATVYSALLAALGRANSWMSATIPRPPITTQQRPIRSVIWPATAATMPARLDRMSVKTKNRNDMWNFTMRICPTLGGMKYWYQRVIDAKITTAR